MNDIRTSEMVVAAALAQCRTLTGGGEELERLWLAVWSHVCTRGSARITPLGSCSPVEVTNDLASVEILAAMDWLVRHEQTARELAPPELLANLRAAATCSAQGSARAARADELHGLTHVSVGAAIAFVEVDALEVAS